MNQIRVLNQAGDIRLEWDPDDEKTWASAEKEFAALVESGFAAYLLPEGGGKRKKVAKFDASAAGDYVFAPAPKSRKDRAKEGLTGKQTRPRALAGGPSARTVPFGAHLALRLSRER